MATRERSYRLRRDVIERLKEERRLPSWEQLAAIAKVDPASLRRWINEGKPALLSRIVRLATALKVTPNQIILGREALNPPSYPPDLPLILVGHGFYSFERDMGESGRVLMAQWSEEARHNFTIEYIRFSHRLISDFDVTAFITQEEVTQLASLPIEHRNAVLARIRIEAVHMIIHNWENRLPSPFDSLTPEWAANIIRTYLAKYFS